MNADWRTHDVLHAALKATCSESGRTGAGLATSCSHPLHTTERGPHDENRSVGRPAQLRRDWVRAGWPLPPRPTNPNEKGDT